MERLVGDCYLHSSADVVGCRRDWDGLLGDVNSRAQALSRNVGEVGQHMLLLAVADVQEHMLVSIAKHLVLNGPGNNVSRSQFQAAVIVGHEPASAETNSVSALCRKFCFKVWSEGKRSRETKLLVPE